MLKRMLKEQGMHVFNELEGMKKQMNQMFEMMNKVMAQAAAGGAGGGGGGGGGGGAVQSQSQSQSQSLQAPKSPSSYLSG